MDSIKNKKEYKEVIEATIALNVIKIDEIWTGYTDITNKWFNILLQMSGLQSIKFNEWKFFKSDNIQLK